MFSSMIHSSQILWLLKSITFNKPDKIRYTNIFTILLIVTYIRPTNWYKRGFKGGKRNQKKEM